MTNNAMPHNDNEVLYASRRSFIPVDSQYSNGRLIAVEELYNFIDNFLSTLLVKNGFKYLKSKKSFVRKTENGIDEIYICSYDYVHYEFDFHFKKRIDNVQKIITELNYQSNFNMSNNYKEQSTIWVCYSNIFKHNIEAISYSHLHSELSKLYSFIEDEILPYFEKLNSLDCLNQTLNYPSQDRKNQFTNFTNDPFSLTFLTSGLVVAKMVKDPNYNIILEKALSVCQQNKYIYNCLGVVDKYLHDRL